MNAPQQYSLASVRLPLDRNISLQQVVLHKEFKGTSICIINDDEFRCRKDMAAPYIDQVDALLKEKQSYIIVVCKSQNAPINLSSVGVINANFENREAVFLAYSRWYFKHVEPKPQLLEILNSKKTYSSILEKFESPRAIEIFFSRLLQPMVARELHELLQRQLGDNQSTKNLNDFFIKQIKEIKKTSALITESPRIWFDKLNNNQKAYAILVGLFQGVNRQVIDRIYEESIQFFISHDADGYYHPTYGDEGISDRLEAISATEEDGSIKFIYSSQVIEVQRQIDNQHAKYWALVPLFEKIIEEMKGPENWEMRRAFGIVIGRLGRAYPEKLVEELNKLANHQSGSVVVVAGYAMAELCHSDLDNYQFVIQQLTKWSRSDFPHFVWAAAAATWRVYGALEQATKDIELSPISAQTAKAYRDGLWKVLMALVQNISDDLSDEIYVQLASSLFDQISQKEVEPEQELENLIRKLILDELQKWRNRNIDAILHAVRKMAHDNLKDVVENLCDWLNDGTPDNTRLVLAELCASQFFIRYEQDDLAPDQCELILLLLRPLIIADLDRAEIIYAAFKNFSSSNWINENLEEFYSWSIDRLFKALKYWIEKFDESETNTILQVVLKIINNLSHRELMPLRACIIRNFLIGNSTVRLKTVGYSLLSRSYSIEGAVNFRFTDRAGVIVLDGSRAGWNYTNSSFTDELFARLDVRCKSLVYIMGSANPVSVEKITNRGIENEYNFLLPKLLFGTLYKLTTDEIKNITILLSTCCGEIVDLDDADNILGDKLILIDLDNSQKKGDEKVQRHESGPQLTITEPVFFNHLDELIQEMFCQEVVRTPSNEQQSVIQRLLNKKKISEGNVIKLINELAKHVDEQTIDVLDDKIGVILFLFSWLSKKDLGKSIDLIASWLDNPALEFLGLATGRLQMQLFSNGQNVSSIDNLRDVLKLISKGISLSPDFFNIKISIKALQQIMVDRHADVIVMPVGLGVSGDRDLLLNFDMFTNIPRPLDKEQLQDYFHVLSSEEGVDPKTSTALHYLTLNLDRPKLLEDQKLGVVLLDVNHLAPTVAFKLIQDFQKELSQSKIGSSYKLVTHLLGQSRPVDIGRVFAVPHKKMPFLSTSIIQRYLSSEVGFIVAVTNSRFVDIGDWIDDWRVIPFVVYTESENLTVEQFIDSEKIYPMLRLLNKQKEMGEKPAQNILKHLEKLLKG